MKKILIVDDNEQNLTLLQTMLKGQGYDVLRAGNGVEALKSARRDPPDIIISDILMPVMDGFALCHEWKKDKKLRHIPFVFYTATYTDARDEELALHLGAARFVVKPQAPEAFLALLRQVIEDFKTDQPSAPVSSTLAGTGYYRLYNVALVRKLEDKVLEMEQLQRVLEQEITERTQIEEALRKSRDQLEVRVQERTAELVQRNEDLTIEIGERLKMEQALKESEKQLRNLASQILSAQENERKRIALEIHDALGSSLSAIKFKMEEVLQLLPKDGPLKISKHLDTLIPLIQDTIGEARRIQADLRPPLLDDLGIVATLSWFSRRFETIYSNIRVEQTVTIKEEEVPDHLKIILFRITQEAMNNIGKHARADAVYLELRKANGIIELSIKDNGEGFDPGSLASREVSMKGLGLSNMKERVEFSGGSFFIDSAKGEGTVVRALWSL
jgi:signal transduction histidine kinase